MIQHTKSSAVPFFPGVPTSLVHRNVSSLVHYVFAWPFCHVENSPGPIKPTGFFLGNSWKICWFPMQSLNQTLKIKTFGEFKGRNGSLRIARNGRQKYVEVHSDTFQIHKPRLTKRAVSIQHRMRLDILWDRGILKLFV